MKAPAALALLALLVLAAHWPVGAADFTFDDKDYIGRNASLLSLGSALDAFDAPFPPHRPDLGLYRPLTNLSYAIDVVLWGPDPFGFHVTNVVLYLVVVGTVYALCRRYRGPPGFALAAAALFAVHPVHCEAVDGITGRSEILALLFSLLAIHAFLSLLGAPRDGAANRFRPTWVWLPPALLAYGLACLSKETGAVLPGVLAVHFVAFGLRSGEPWRRRTARGAAVLAPFAAVLAVYLVARVDALGSFAPGTPVLPPDALGLRIHAIGVAFYRYAGLLVFPNVLQVDFYWADAFLEPGAWRLQAGLGWILLGTTLGLLLRFLPEALRPAQRGDLAKLAWCGTATCLVFLLPVSHLFPIGAYMAERFLFAPSFGFCVAAVALGGAALERAVASPRRRAQLAAAALALLAAAGTARSRARADEWRDDLGFWLAAERALPDDARVLANQASAYLERGRYREARRAVDRARRSEPHLPQLDRLLAQYDRALRERHGL